MEMKPIWKIEDLSNLQDVVVQDLKLEGIKVPRTKKAKSQDMLHCENVFGNYLCNLPFVPIDDCGHVPRFLVSAIEFVEQSIDAEGLFRKSGAVSRQKELKQLIENDKGFDDAQVTIFDVTGVVKQFFRELPEPLLTNRYHDTFIKCYQLADKTSAATCMLSLCLLLPGEHLGTLRYMMKFLARVAANSEKNKMDAVNLAVVLGPNIMHANTNKTEKMNSSEEKLLQTQTAIVEFLIRNADKIGMVDSELCVRVELMGYLPNEDELSNVRVAETPVLIMEEPKKNKKKKRRSSSLQGLVSNIASSIAKWRTTSVKTNTSQLSTGNSSSNENIPSVISTPLPVATPKMMRKRKASGEVMAISATKRKAILQQMSRSSALANTPYTPVSKRFPPEVERALENGTPSINFTKEKQMEFTATPDKKKTPRKRLSLFSPGGSRKSKIWSSSNASLNSKPATPIKEKKKGIFRRLSGGKSKYRFISRPIADIPSFVIRSFPWKESSMDLEQSCATLTNISELADSPCVVKTSLNTDIGERLASPTGPVPELLNVDLTRKGSKRKDKSTPVRRDSPISAIVQATNSPRLRPEKDGSLGHFLSPNKGSKKKLTLQQHSSPAVIPSGDRLINCGQMVVNVKLHRRAKSADASRIQRGRPNAVANGLNSGEVQLPLRTRRGQDQLKCSRSKSIHTTSHHQLVIENPYASRAGIRSDSSLDKSQVAQRKRDKNQNRSFTKKDIVHSIILPPPDQFADSMFKEEEEEMNCDSDESEAGFSTISGDTVIFVPAVNPSIMNECGDMSITRAVNKLEASVSKKENAGDEGGSDLIVTDGCVQSGELSSGLKTSTKCSSLDNLQKPSAKEVSSSVMRSQSMYESLQMHTRRRNGVPNLQVSSDTHKLLARAGYFREMEKVTEEGSLLETPKREKSEKREEKKVSEEELRTHSQRNHQTISRDKKGRKISPCKTVSHNEAMVQACEMTAPVEERDKDKGSKSADIAPIKRATVEVPRHESVLDLKANYVGKVAEAAQRFSGTNSKEVTEMIERHTSPLRFPNSTSRTRGSSPVRIPTIFAKTDKEAEKFRQIALNTIKETRVSRASANLPISTQLLRPSEEATRCASEREDSAVERTTGFKRKPSIYKVKHDVGRLSSSGSTSKSPKSGKEKDVSISSVDSRLSPSVLNTGILDVTDMEDDVFNVTPHPVAIKLYGLPEENCESSCVSMMDVHDSSLNLSNFSANNALVVSDMFQDTVKPFELSESLHQTIKEVCTPLSEKLLKTSEYLDKTPLRDSNSVNIPEERHSCTPRIKQPLIKSSRTNQMKLRTASGMTPRHILLSGMTPSNRFRSPLKPVKRLGSPGTPSSRRSPRRPVMPCKAPSQTTNNPVFSSVPTYLQDELSEEL